MATSLALRCASSRSAATCATRAASFFACAAALALREDLASSSAFFFSARVFFSRPPLIPETWKPPRLTWLLNLLLRFFANCMCPPGKAIPFRTAIFAVTVEMLIN